MQAHGLAQEMATKGKPAFQWQMLLGVPLMQAPIEHL